MKTFKATAAQGDVYLRSVDSIPESAQPSPAKAPLIVAHSEDGNHHRFRKDDSVFMFVLPENPFICYLRVDAPALLEHAKTVGAHESILVPTGLYEIRRQRERARTPSGWVTRMVQD